MAFVSDSEIDIELKKTKNIVETLRQKQRTFSHTYKMVTTKERAKLIKDIEAHQRQVQIFLEKIKQVEIFNSGTKFGIENLKQSFIAIKTLWMKTIKTMETSGTGPVTHPEGGSTENLETDSAVKNYEAALKNLGHEINPSQISEFKSRLATAYGAAKEKGGGKELSIQILEEGGIIKVKMTPKV